jgi:tRNA(Arg) A34 adenosine deaminase TadA
MNIKEKIKIADKAIESISTHSDEDSVVILAALSHVKGLISAKEDNVRETQARLAHAALAG